MLSVWTILILLFAAADHTGRHAGAEIKAPPLPDNPNFVRHVMPLLGRLGCSTIACHGSFKEQSRLRLSILGRVPRTDFERLHRESVLLSASNPESSLLLTKPTGEDDHNGGKLFDKDSWQYELIQRWISQGAPYGSDEPVVKLDVEPSLYRLSIDDPESQIHVWAMWPDGTREEVSHLSSFLCNNDQVISLDREGRVRRGDRAGSAQVVVRYGQAFCVATVLSLRESSDEVRASLPIQTPIDRFIGSRLDELGIEPSSACTDAEFLRRISIDVTGLLPSEQELEKFVANNHPAKRSHKVEELLSRDSYSWRWANLLALLSGCDERELYYAASELGVSAPQLAYLWLDWLRVRVARDEPYDQIVAGILLGTSRDGKPYHEYAQYEAELRERLKHKFDDGGLYADRKTNDIFWRRYSVIYDRQRPAEAVAEAFLGIHLECARCHDHPTDRWTQSDHDGFSATFQRVVYSELPIERSEKLTILASTGGSVAFAVLTLGAISAFFQRRGRRVISAFGFSGLAAMAGILACTSASYLHLLASQPSAPVRSPGLMVVNLLEKTIQVPSNRPFAIGLLGIGLTFLAGFFVYIGKRSWTNGPRLSVIFLSLAAALASAGAATIFDAWFVSSQAAERAREPLAHHLHRRVLRRLGLGGCGQQPREVFVADANYPRIGTPKLLDGTVLREAVGQDPRAQLVDWLQRSGETYLARNIVNRIWAEYFGHGLVDPPDDLSESNPPSHPELLDWLARDFVQNNWSLKHLHRTILNSATYHRSWRPTLTNADDEQHYGRFYPRRLKAEQLIQAIDALTGTASDFGRGNLPVDGSAFQVAVLYPEAPTCGARALRTFGRGSLGNQQMRIEGAMFTLLDSGIREKIADPNGRLARLLASNHDRNRTLDDIYRVALARLPDDLERARILIHLDQASDERRAWQEVMWAIMNSEEFQFNF